MQKVFAFWKLTQVHQCFIHEQSINYLWVIISKKIILVLKLIQNQICISQPLPKYHLYFQVYIFYLFRPIFWDVRKNTKLFIFSECIQIINLEMPSHRNVQKKIRL